MVRAVRYVRSHGLHGIAVTVAGLDLCPAGCIGIVAPPDLREETEYSEIEPVTAGRAALEEDIGESPCKLSHYPVQPQDISVGNLALPVSGKGP